MVSVYTLNTTKAEEAYQTHSPQMRTFALNDRYMKYLLQRVRYVMKFTLSYHAITRGHIMANRPNCLSCPPRRFVVERAAKSAKKRSRDLSENQ